MGFEIFLEDRISREKFLISNISSDVEEIRKIVCGLTEYRSDQISRVTFYLESMVESWKSLRLRIEAARYFQTRSFEEFVRQSVIHEHRHVQQYMFFRYLGGEEFLEFMLWKLMQMDYEDSPIEFDAYLYQLAPDRSIAEILKDPIILDLIHEFESL